MIGIETKKHYTINDDTLLCFSIILSVNLLPTGSEEGEVLGVGSIPIAILPSCQNMKIIALQLHNMNKVG